MSQTLVIDLPDEVYKVLEELATEAGKSIHELGAEWLSLMVTRILDDPLERVIGSLRTGVPNWSDRHDELLGNYLSEKMGRGDSPDEGA